MLSQGSKTSKYLIFYPRGSNDYPVGKWKISDFGISTIIEPERRPSTSAGVVDTFVHTVHTSATPRIPGAYQPPEVCSGGRFGRRSDVWSLGCILTRILALGLEGKRNLQDLDAKRRKDADGVSNYLNDHFHRGSPAVLNPHIEAWVGELPDRSLPYSIEFLQECRRILLAMLAINKDDRPSAKTVSHLLHDLTHSAYRIEPNGSISGDDPSSPPSSLPQSDRSSVISPDRPSLGSIASQPIPVEFLVDAIKRKRERGIETMLMGAIDVEQSHEGDRPLIHAIRMEYIQAVEMLLNYREGLDLETTDSQGYTPLRIATDAGNHEMVSLLLNHGAFVDGRSESETTPLMRAARHGDRMIAETLLTRGANILASSSHGYTCLHYTSYSKTGGEVIRLFRNRVPFDISRSTTGETPLLTLVKNFADNPYWWDKFNAMLEGGASVSVLDERNTSPLCFAVTQNYYPLARRLVQLEAQYGPTPLPRKMSTQMKNLMRTHQNL